MQRALIVRYSQIGDVLIMLPVIYSLAKQYPDEEFTVLTNPKFGGLFKQMPGNVRLYPMIYRKKHVPLRGLVYLFDRYTLLLKIFFSGKFDKVALLQRGTFDSQLKTLLSLRGSRVESIDLTDFLSSEKLVKKDYFNTPSLNQLCIQTLSRLGYHHLKNEIDLSSYRDKEIQLELKRKIGLRMDVPIIGIAPFSRIKRKVYPLDRMEQVIKYFHNRPDVQLVVFGGGAKEKALAEQWEKKYPGIYSLIDKLSFDDEIFLITACTVMLSMDSANMHLASLLQVPTISVWGPSHPGLGYYPVNEARENAVQRELPCRPCSFFGENPCTDSTECECMNIDPEIIIQKINVCLENNNK